MPLPGLGGLPGLSGTATARAPAAAPSASTTGFGAGVGANAVAAPAAAPAVPVKKNTPKEPTTADRVRQNASALLDFDSVPQFELKTSYLPHAVPEFLVGEGQQLHSDPAALQAQAERIKGMLDKDSHALTLASIGAVRHLREGTADYKQFGTTGTISLADPTPLDLWQTAKLEECLRDFELFEDEAEAQHREGVLGQLYCIVKDWVRDISIRKGMSLKPDECARIFTFGSYRLGVHGKDADIDTLCVVPRHVDREEFFTVLAPQLKAHEKVTECKPVPNAHVPVIKMIFDGIDIDLLCARLDVLTIPQEVDLVPEQMLANLSEKDVLSLNGSRVTDQILRLVPNIPAFRMTLRFVKLWSKRRGTYANVVGYLGGVAWALLVARVCQLWPNALPNTLVRNFFHFYTQWRWPNPICLNAIIEGSLGLRVWNPQRNVRDGYHLMPVITPAYPAMNSTYNVSKSTFYIMHREIDRGCEFVKGCFNGSMALANKTSLAEPLSSYFTENNLWLPLFDKVEFFTQHRLFVEIEAIAQTKDDFSIWEGWCESRLRLFIGHLENTPGIRFAHPNTSNFPHTITGVSVEEATKDQEVELFATSFFFGLMLEQEFEDKSSDEAEELNLTQAAAEFRATVMAWDDRNEYMQLRIQTCPRNQIVKKKYIPESSRRAIKQLRKSRRAGASKRKTVEPVGTGTQEKIHEPERNFVAPGDPSNALRDDADASDTAEPATKRARADTAEEAANV